MRAEAGLLIEGFDALSARTADSLVFIEDDCPVTFGSLREASRTLANRLSAIAAGRVAAFCSRPSFLATCLLACAEAGKELLILRSPYVADDPALALANVGTVIEEADFHILRVADLNTSAEEPAVLISTSGTSGSPKIARHRLGALMGRIRRAPSQRAPARWLLTYQLQGFAGLQMVLTAVATDSTMVALSQTDVPRLARAAVDHSVTHISGTPTFWRSFLIALGNSAAELNLQQITLGGEIVDQAVLERLAAAFPNAQRCHIYASTEAGALFSVRDGQAGFPARWLDEPVDSVRLRIREGVLEVRSPREMLGYLNDRHVPRSPDGWMMTGDRVEQRGDRVYFLGREDSLINVGGGKVTPEEVESALLDVPGILDLRAFPVPNPITGFIVGLEVVAVPEADVEQLRKKIVSIARQKLTAYKVPRLIRFVEAVHSDESGKKSRHSQ